MRARPTRYLTDRDLRALTTAELLDLIKQDIRDLDRVWRERPRPAPVSRTPEPPAERDSPRKQASRTRQNTVQELEPEPTSLYIVACCNSKLGEFLAGARVRCPFCGTWHTASGP